MPANAAAAVLNVTVTGATGGGYVTAWPCGEPQPNASSLNYTAGATVPNAVVVKLGTAGKVCLFVGVGDPPDRRRERVLPRLTRPCRWGGVPAAPPVPCLLPINPVTRRRPLVRFRAVMGSPSSRGGCS